jgi:4-amino-4-deoxy-L-arabinose transferase-like glycosyltransferase
VVEYDAASSVGTSFIEEQGRILMSRPRLVFIGIVLLAVLIRLYHINAPLVDQMFTKQAFVANKARAIAGPPLNLLASRFDFLDDNGERLQLVEEAPAYTGLVGASYWLFGEREWLGRVWSILASLVALVAFKDLVRREFDDTTALVGTLLLAMTPLFIFYGRAILPDPLMLAGMLAAACSYRRFLDGEGRGWWLLALVAGGAAAVFKYYGLMVLLPLADMMRRQAGWRGLYRPQFVLLAIGMFLPVALWTIAVFGRNPNPSQAGVYFLFQQPALLADGVLYKRLVERFLWKDCGPPTMLFVFIGLGAVVARHTPATPVYSWTGMGLLFYFLLGPKLERHDYYELMMLPAAAMWAALGWRALWANASLRRVRWGVGALLVTVVIQSPFVMPAKFRLETGFMILADRFQQICPPNGRFIVIGPEWTHPVIHYSGREGWTLAEDTLGTDWPNRLAHYRALGADFVAIYLNALAKAEQRNSYEPLLSSLPVLEHRGGSWSRKGDAEYYILDLRPPSLFDPKSKPSQTNLSLHQASASD